MRSSACSPINCLGYLDVNVMRVLHGHRLTSKPVGSFLSVRQKGLLGFRTFFD
jgi:hypothetical protein